MSQNLKDKVALVTGSGRGLGESTALLLASLGAHLVVNDLNPENCQKVAKQAEEHGGEVLQSHHDVSDYSQAHSLMKEIEAKWGRIDIVVNNAGITRDALLVKMTEEQWDQVIRVNLKGVFNVGQAAVQLMLSQKTPGRIVNISSVAWLGNVGQTNYSASKAGVVGMTRTWALELGKKGIRVNAIAPGFIDSVLTQQVPKEVLEKFVQKIPAGRIGRPEDIAGLVAFLVSDAAEYLTGQVIQMDGGLSVGL